MVEFEQGTAKLNKFLVVAFYTVGTPYETVLETYLMPSLEKFRIPYAIEPIPNKGSWIKNVAEKPAVIGRALLANPAYDIVSLDADAQILEFPQLFNEIPEQYDIALHRLDWRNWYGHNTDKKEILSGTIFLRNNERTQDIVKEWHLLATHSNEWEQKCLEKVLEERKVDIFDLPLEYCYITSLPNGDHPKVQLTNPVIIHNQVSRIYKKLIR